MFWTLIDLRMKLHCPLCGILQLTVLNANLVQEEIEVVILYLSSTVMTGLILCKCLVN